MQPRWHEPTTTPEGELLLIVKELEATIIQKNKYCSICKNMSCSDHEDCGPQVADYKSDRGEKTPPDLPKSKKQKHTKEKKGKKEKTKPDTRLERTSKFTRPVKAKPEPQEVEPDAE